jgi:hypothetical protein
MAQGLIHKAVGSPSRLFAACKSSFNRPVHFNFAAVEPKNDAIGVEPPGLLDNIWCIPAPDRRSRMAIPRGFLALPGRARLEPAKEKRAIIGMTCPENSGVAVAALRFNIPNTAPLFQLLTRPCEYIPTLAFRYARAPNRNV